jgi:hypothetical protein
MSSQEHSNMTEDEMIERGKRLEDGSNFAKLLLALFPAYAFLMFLGLFTAAAV